MAVVEELEVVDVEEDERERLLVARRRVHRAGELVLEDAMVRQVGQAVARRTLERDAVAAQQRPPAYEVEDDRSGEQREQPDQSERAPGLGELGVQHGVVVADLEDVATAGQLDRRDELEVAPVEVGIGLEPGVGDAVAQAGDDPRVGVSLTDHVLVHAGADDDRTLIDQQRLERAGTFADHVQQTLDRGALAMSSKALEIAHVGVVVTRVLGDLAGPQLMRGQQVADRSDNGERDRDRQCQPCPEAHAATEPPPEPAPALRRHFPFRCVVHSNTASASQAEVLTGAVSVRPTPALRQTAPMPQTISTRRCLLLLGAAGLAGGRPVDEVEAELRRMGAVLGVPDAQCAATPTGLFVSLGSDEPRAFRASARRCGSIRAPRSRGSSTACSSATLDADGAVAELRDVLAAPPLVPRWVAAAGLVPVDRRHRADPAALARQPLAGALCAMLVALLIELATRSPLASTLLPVVAAFIVGCAIFLAAEADLLEGPLRTLAAAAGRAAAGRADRHRDVGARRGRDGRRHARLVFGSVQLLLFTFGLLAAVRVVGVQHRGPLQRPRRRLRLVGAVGRAAAAGRRRAA